MKDITGRRVKLARKGGIRRLLGRRHWDEFGRTKMRGTVIGPMAVDWTQANGLPPWPEWDVRWDNGLKYGYRRECLVVLP